MMILQIKSFFPRNRNLSKQRKGILPSLIGFARAPGAALIAFANFEARDLGLLPEDEEEGLDEKGAFREDPISPIPADNL